MLNYNILMGKVNRKYRAKFISYFRSKSYYTKLYKSYWHYRFNKTNINKKSLNYYTAIPNPGAGIGHQMANWIAGYWFTQQFGLQFAHIPFSRTKWESFLGFGENEKKIDFLLDNGYKKIRLPLFNEFNENEINLQKKIIDSYSNKKIVFVGEQDQFYQNQFEIINHIQEKFHTAPSRNQDKLIYNPNNFNIAIHVRRGDIIIGQENKNDNLLMRWQGNEYFVKVLENILTDIETNKPIYIYLFSQGVESDFLEFTKFKNITLCLDMNAQDSFLHMVFADVLITSKSSFSYKPALLNKNTKVCPKDFWHGYPITKDWIMVNEDGTLNLNLNE